MKKRLWSLMLCLMLVCTGFAGCGSNDDEDAGASAAPEKMVTAKMQEAADSISDILKKTENETVSVKNQGLDLTLNAKIGEQIAANYGLDGLSSAGLKMYMDIKESAEFFAAGNLLLNDQNVIEAEVVKDKENIYLNLPAYSEQYMGMSYEDICNSVFGMSFDELMSSQASTEGIPTTEDMLNIWNTFSAKFIAAFQYQNMEKDQKIGSGDYEFTGDKYITTASAEDIDDALQALVDELKKFPKLEVEEISKISSEADSFNVNYYTGKNKAYAWEIEIVKGEDVNSAVFVSTEKGFKLYAVNDDEEKVLIYSVKESDKKGQITICADDEDIVVNYDNYTKDSVDLSMTVNGMAINFKYKSVDDKTKIDFDVNLLGIVVKGSLESSKGSIELTVSVASAGIEFGTINLIAKARDFKNFSVPTSYVDQNTWVEGLNQEKLMSDLSQLMMQFPFLMDLMN